LLRRERKEKKAKAMEENIEEMIFGGKRPRFS